MKILAVGCSFTYGDELDDPLNDAWPSILSKNLGIEIYNAAVKGGTNSRNVYHVIKNLDLYDAFIVSWTDHSRYTFYCPDTNAEININPRLRNDLLLSIPNGELFGRTLYQNLHNELFSFKLWLQQIISLQRILKGRRYVMLNAFDNRLNNWCADRSHFIDSVRHLLCHENMNDEQIFDQHQEISYYLSLIDLDKFYGWRHFYIAQLCKDYACGPRGHFLEQGHKHMAHRIQDHVQNQIINS